MNAELLLLHELLRRFVDQAELQRSSAGFRIITEQTPDGIFVHRDGRLVHVNPAQVRMLGYERANEILGKRIEGLIHPDDRHGASTHLAAAHKSDAGPMHWLGRLLRKDETSVEVEMSSLPITFDGRPALLSSVRDMSERRQLIAHMMETDRISATGTLGAGVGHAINHPLAQVLGNLEFALTALRELGDPALAEVEQAIEAARAGSLRIKEVTRDLRSLTRSEAPALAPVNLRATIESAVKMVAHELRHRAALVLDLQPTPHVQGDEARLGQVLVNLLVNAAHAIEEGTKGAEIRVRTAFDAATSRVIVEVTDTGSGIDEAVRDHLFDPFVTTKPRSRGRGLGLAICRQIVEAHRGEISFQTQRGRGTTFRVVLPVSDAPSASAAAEPAPTAQGRVLIIDDDAMLVQAFGRVLCTEQEVVGVTSGREGLEQLATAGPPFDVILCDLMMPELSGMDVFERVEASDPATARRFLFMTGGAFSPHAQQFVQKHQEHTIAKPIRADALRQLVGRRMSELRSS
jgi:PAS domain S-box-containing protein